VQLVGADLLQVAQPFSACESVALTQDLPFQTMGFLAENLCASASASGVVDLPSQHGDPSWFLFFHPFRRVEPNRKLWKNFANLVSRTRYFRELATSSWLKQRENP